MKTDNIMAKESTTAKAKAQESPKSVFATLAAINCNEHTEKKNNLTYLSWAWAWNICKMNFPDAQYTIYENADGRPYFDDGRTAWVKTGITIQGQEHIEYLPIMDYANKSIPVQRITSMDMNKAIQRSLTKAIARHGLGLYIYAGEDLPDAADDKTREEVNAEVEAENKKAAAKKATAKKAPQERTKQPAPQRGGDTWMRWVNAICTNPLSKSGQEVDWRQAFIENYACDQDLLDCLDEDCFNYRMDNNIA